MNPGTLGLAEHTALNYLGQDALYREVVQAKQGEPQHVHPLPSLNTSTNYFQPPLQEVGDFYLIRKVKDGIVVDPHSVLPEARLRAAQALKALGEERVILACIDHLRSPVFEERRRYNAALGWLTYRDFGLHQYDSPEQREGIVGKWRTWWQENRSTFRFKD